jgi:hypothetical protein
LPCFQARLKLRGEPGKVPKRDSLTDCSHQVKKKMHIVMGVQDGAENFMRLKKMPQVRA